jgi:hypothetical protein
MPLGLRVRRAFPLHVGALVIMAALTGRSVFAQGAAPPSTVPAAQNGGGVSPDTLSPVSGQMQSHEQVPDAAQGQSSSPQPAILSYGTPGVRTTVLEDTLIRVMTDQPLSTKRSKDGTPVSFSVSEDVIVNHVLVIPRGATVHGEVVQDKKAGRLSGSPELTLELVSLDLGGESYPLYTYQFKVRGASKTKPTATQVEGGAVVGALAGGVVASSAKGGATPGGYAADMAAGAAVGAGAVAAVSAATPRPVLVIPAESQMDFYLAAPISVQPVSAKEAEQLAQRLHPGAPVLYVRGDTP